MRKCAVISENSVNTRHECVCLRPMLKSPSLATLLLHFIASYTCIASSKVISARLTDSKSFVTGLVVDIWANNITPEMTKKQRSLPKSHNNNAAGILFASSSVASVQRSKSSIFENWLDRGRLRPICKAPLLSTTSPPRPICPL